MPIDLHRAMADALASVELSSLTIVGLGIDVVDVADFRARLDRSPRFAARAFTQQERDYVAGSSDPGLRLAARFAAKEAAMKSLGIGIGVVSFDSIEVVSAFDEPPRLRLHGDAIEVAEECGVTRFLVSLSHVERVATAAVIAVGTNA